VVTSVDFYPTFLELAGLIPDPDQVLDGESLVNIISNGQEKYDRPVFWHYPVYHHGQPASVIRKGDYKLIENLVDGSLELYHLVDDIGESHNLAASMKDKTAELYGLLQAWQKEVKAEFPVPNPEFNPDKRYEWGKHPDRN
jgi:arylsulfatase A